MCLTQLNPVVLKWTEVMGLTSEYQSSRLIWGIPMFEDRNRVFRSREGTQHNAKEQIYKIIHRNLKSE